MSPIILRWFKDIVGAFIIGASHAGKAFLALVAGNYVNGDIPTIGWRGFLTIMAVSGLLELMKVLELNPLPGWAGGNGNGKPPASLPMPLFLGACLALGLMGCGGDEPVNVAPAPSTGTTVAKVQDEAEAFWQAMKGDLGKAREFLASPVAQKNAPIFARVVWKLGLAGARAAEVDLVPVAQVGVPVCDVVISLTGSAAAVTSTQIDAVLAGTGSRDSLAAYNPFLTLAGPVMDWITEACGDDTALAKFYLRVVATEGKTALTPFLPGARLGRGERYAEEWADRPRLLPT